MSDHSGIIAQWQQATITAATMKVAWESACDTLADTTEATHVLLCDEG
ncbi:unnamed protein product, partial [marine sediment metagenome]